MIKFRTGYICSFDRKLKLSWHKGSEGLQTTTQHTPSIRVNVLRIDILYISHRLLYTKQLIPFDYCPCLLGYEIKKNRPVNLFSHNISYGVWYAWSCLSLSKRLGNKFILELPMRVLSTSSSLIGC